jgi:hypothetical protein
MSPAEVLDIAADLADGRPTTSQAVDAVLHFLDCYPDARRLLYERIPAAGLVLSFEASPAQVAKSLHAAARQAGQGLAA